MFMFASHLLRVHEQVLNEAGEPAQHEIKGDGAVRADDPLHRGVADVPLVPEGDVFQRGHGICRRSLASPPSFSQDGVLLVGHGGGALLARRKRLLGLEDLGSLEVADLRGELVEGGADDGKGREVLGVAVPLEDLGGDRGRLQPEFAADILSTAESILA